MACQQDVEDIAILVYGSPKIMTFAADGDEQLVHVPDVAAATAPLTICAEFEVIISPT